MSSSTSVSRYSDPFLVATAHHASPLNCFFVFVHDFCACIAAPTPYRLGVFQPALFPPIAHHAVTRFAPFPSVAQVRPRLPLGA